MASLVNSIKYLKKNKLQSFSNSSKKLESREYFQIHFTRTVLQSQMRTLQEKKITDEYSSLMNTQTKIFNKILANQIQISLKGLYTMLNGIFSLGYQIIQYTHIKQCDT